MRRLVGFLFTVFVGWWLPQGWYRHVSQLMRQGFEDRKGLNERARKFMSDATGAEQITGVELK